MKIFKKIIAILVVAALALSFAGCGDKTLTLDDIKKAGQLTIATSPDFPPFEMLTDDGKVEGIEIDILELICKEIGVDLKIEQMNFDSVIPGIQAGKFDVGVSGISVTPEREKNMLFTDPYCLAAQAIVVTKDSDIKAKADLKDRKIAVQSGTTAESYCMDNDYNVSAYQANNDAESALLAGKVDAWVIDDLTAADMVKTYNAEKGEELIILDEAMTTEPYAFAFAFGSEELVKEINEIVNGLVKDGTVASIFDKYEAPYTKPETK